MVNIEIRLIIFFAAKDEEALYSQQKQAWEIGLPYDPAIPLLGIHTEETRSQRDTCTPMFITALFTIARTWKQPRCPSADEWIRKLWNMTQPLKRIHLNQF